MAAFGLVPEAVVFSGLLGPAIHVQLVGAALEDDGRDGEGDDATHKKDGKACARVEQKGENRVHPMPSWCLDVSVYAHKYILADAKLNVRTELDTEGRYHARYQIRP